MGYSDAVRRHQVIADDQCTAIWHACCDGVGESIAARHWLLAYLYPSPFQHVIPAFPPQIDVRAVKLGDETMSVLEIWGAEYQENDCLLIKPDARGLLEAICARERCIMQARRFSWTARHFSQIRRCCVVSCLAAHMAACFGAVMRLL